MSKASEWAKREKARTDALEIESERINKALGEDGSTKPGPFLNGLNVLADVVRFGDDAKVRISSSSPQHLVDAKRALEFARWILDTFEDKT